MDKDFEDYLETAEECLEIQAEIREEFLKMALSKLGIEREEFEEEKNKLPPQMQQILAMNKSLKPQTDPAFLPQGLSRAKTKEIFLETMSLQDRDNEEWKELYLKIDEYATGMGQVDAMEFAGGITQLLLVDILQIKYKVTEEQYSAAVQKYQIAKDPEIRSILQQQAMMGQMMGAQ